MQEGEKRLAIVAVLSVANIPAFNIQFGAIWHAWGWNPRVNAALLALLAVWIASATVLSIQVSGDLSKPFREQANVPSRSPWRDSCELRRGSDV
jgi:hypothetical protein